MAETLTYDPSNDPQAIKSAEERDADSLAVGQAMEDQQNQLLAGKYKSAQDLEKAYIELQQKLGSNDQQAEPQQEDTPEPEQEQIQPLNYLIVSMVNCQRVVRSAQSRLRNFLPWIVRIWSMRILGIKTL